MERIIFGLVLLTNFIPPLSEYETSATASASVGGSSLLSLQNWTLGIIHYLLYYIYTLFHNHTLKQNQQDIYSPTGEVVFDIS